MKDELVATCVGLVTVSLTHLLMGAAQSFVLGFAGAMGGWLFAKSVGYIKKRISKKDTIK